MLNLSHFPTVWHHKTISHDLHSKWLVFKSWIYSVSYQLQRWYRNYPMITKVLQNITLGSMPSTCPPTGPNSFVFAYIFAKKCPRWRSTPHPVGPRPPYGKSWIRHWRRKWMAKISLQFKWILFRRIAAVLAAVPSWIKYSGRNFIMMGRIHLSRDGWQPNTVHSHVVTP